nr:uncharacterized protein LOC112021753 [Quercus suber]XP_023917290.1 uncharacterized protein LOC112028796 [Quercus suber]
MEDAKRRAAIRLQAAKNKKKGTDAMGTGSSKPSLKRKLPMKGDGPSKQPKVPLDPVLGLMAEGSKSVPPSKHGKGKGLMTGQPGEQKKPPVLLREDSKYALERMSSIITTDDFEDLGNHSTEAMGETALFSIAQAMIMTKGLMGRCLNQETTIGRLREKAKVTEGDLLDLKAWKITHEKKLGMAETARDEAVQMVENLKKALVDKDNEVRHAKEEAVREYRDSSEVIAELSVVYNDGFDDALRQVRRLYPDLDLSAVSVSAPEPSTAQPAQTEDTDALFDEDGVVREAPLDHTAVDSKVKDAGDRPDVEEDGA